MTERLEGRIDSAPRKKDETASARSARRILAIAAAVSAAGFAVACVGLLIDPRIIGGAPAWLKPAKFGVSITVYLLTLRWMLGSVHGGRRLLTTLSTVVTIAFALEVLWIDGQVLRGTTSHFNESTVLDATAFDAAGGVISLVFVATIMVAVLALRTRGLDAGIAAGMRWGLAVCGLGMLEAVSMIVNFGAGRGGGHTVGAADGGPGMALTDWSLAHGDLRIGHFVGLHALQVLPLIAWALWRWTPLGPLVRRDLLRVAGVGAAAMVVLVWWQAERGQALLHPDAATLAAAGLVVAAVSVGVVAVLFGRRAVPVPLRRLARRAVERPLAVAGRAPRIH